MRHDKLRQWASDNGVEDEKQIPHQSIAERVQTEPMKMDLRSPSPEPLDEEQELDIEREVPEERHEPEISEEEIKARHMGWVPKSEWHGDPDEWTPAKRFVQTGELIQANRNLHSKIDHLENQFQSRIENLQKLHEAQLTATIGKLKAERDQAVEEADTEKYKLLNDEIEKLQQPEISRPSNQQSQTNNQNIDPQTFANNVMNHPTMVDWRNRNPWITDKSPKSKWAESVFVDWVNQNISNPNATLEQALAHVDQSVAREFAPTNSNRAMPSISEKAGSPMRREAHGLTLNDLTREERLIWQTMGHTWKDQQSFLQAVRDNREKRS